MELEIKRLDELFAECKKQHKKAQRLRWLVIIFGIVVVSSVGFCAGKFFVEEKWLAFALELCLFWFDVILIFQNLIRTEIAKSDFWDFERKHKDVMEKLRSLFPDGEQENTDGQN